MGAGAWRQEENDIDRRTSDVAYEIIEGKNRRSDFEPWRGHS
jgi:hypothetical protein